MTIANLEVDNNDKNPVDQESFRESTDREKTPLTDDDEDGKKSRSFLSSSRFGNNNLSSVAIINLEIDNDQKSIDHRTYANEFKTNPVNYEPPDGGLRAWSVMMGSFLINGVLFGIINNYSLVYPELQSRLKAQGASEVSSKAAIVGSLTIGTTFFLSPVAGVLTDKIGIRLTTFIGGGLAALGMFLSSFLVNKVSYLCITYGLMYGVGASLAYTPSLVILGHYFKKRLGLVNGFVTMGSSMFTIILPNLLQKSIETWQLETTFRLMAALTACLMFCATIFKPMPIHSPIEEEQILQKKDFKSVFRELVQISIWTNKKYVIWACAIPVALFGYFVPYVHIAEYVDTTFKGNSRTLPIMCCGITSAIGRLVFGYVADFPKVNRILLQQISFVSIGILTMMIPLATTYPALIAILLGMGLFDGCFISLLGPIAFDICGPREAAQAIGFLLGMCSIPLTVGPPIAGAIYDHNKSYALAFRLGGLSPIICACMMCLIYFVKNKSVERREDKESSVVSSSVVDSKFCNDEYLSVTDKFWIQDRRLR